jgi:hypothetical protein
MSYSKRAHTFRTADGNCPAARTRLGSPSFVGFNKTRSVPAGFIFEHVPQHRPACIQNGFSHPRLGKLCGADIADNDKRVFRSNLAAGLVELILANISNLGVDSFDAALVTSALCNGECNLVFAIVLQGGNSIAVAACGEHLQPEVNSYLAVASWQIVSNFTLETNIPATTSVLGKAARPDGVVGNVPRFPEMEFALEVDNMRAFKANSTLDKWEPSEGALGATTSAETRGVPSSVARDYKLFADLADRIGVQPKLCRATRSQFDEIEVRRPAALRCARLVIGFNLALDFTTVVPNKIDRTRVSVEILPDCRILDPVLESQNHADYLLGLRRDFKWTSTNIVGVDIPLLNWSVILYLLQSIVENSLTIQRLIGSKATLARSAAQWIVCLLPVMAKKITFTCLLSTRRSTPSLPWLMRSREHRLDFSDLSVWILLLVIGAALFGPRPILPPVLVALRLIGSSDTWKLNGLPPRRERRGFRPRLR